MSQMTWWAVARSCSECQGETNLFELAYSADSELAISFACPKCRKSFTWRVYASQLAHDALCRDMAKCHKKVIPVAAQPVITPENFTEEDQKFLKLFNITPPKKEKN